MAPDPKCAAVAAAQARTGFSNATLAAEISKNGTAITEARVAAIITGASPPTAAEFTALASALGITDSIPAGHPGGST